MRAIVINPHTRTIRETSFTMAPDFMRGIAEYIGADALALDVAPPHTAMFLDAIGFLRDLQAFWRKADADMRQNVAGTGIMFGLAPDGRLTDLPPEITVESLLVQIVWAGDTIERTVERMEIVQFPAGPAPRVSREVVWAPGVAVSASDVATAVQKQADVEADVYAQGSPPAPAQGAPAAHATGDASNAAVATLDPIWAIHETADNRYRVIEYEVSAAGLGAPLSLSTVPNIDEARARVPKGLMMRPADDDVEDDTLVETWS